MSRSRKWLKWGVGTGATLTIVLLFQAVKQNDTFLHAVTSNQDRLQWQIPQMSERDSTSPYRTEHQTPTETRTKTSTIPPVYFTFPKNPASSLEKTPHARTHASSVVPGRANDGQQKQELDDEENHDWDEDKRDEQGRNEDDKDGDD